jgi:hypothetical protein
VDSFETEVKIQTLLLVVEAVAYLVLALWCVNRRREGSWALVGAVGAALVGVVLGLFAASAVEGVFFEGYRLSEWLFAHPHRNTIYLVARVAGVLLLASAFVQSRRTPPAPTGAIYGSG